MQNTCTMLKNVKRNQFFSPFADCSIILQKGAYSHTRKKYAVYSKLGHTYFYRGSFMVYVVNA